MDRTTLPRRVAVALALTLVANAVLLRPALAQDGSGDRMSILVPAFANKSAGKNSFGQKIAEEVEKRLENMPTHQPVDMRNLRNQFRQYGLKQEDLSSATDGCIKTRQFAGLTGIKLIMCGEYEPRGDGGTVTARIINPATQDVFEIEPFSATDPRQAADQIVGRFQSYVEQIQLLTYCNDYLQSQQFPNALENCEKALALNPKSKVGLMGKAQALEKLDRKPEALAVLKQLIELDALGQDAILRAALLSAELQRTEESEKYFREYLSLNPTSVPVRLKIAGDAMQAGNPEVALSIVEDGIKRDSANNVQLRLYGGHFAMSAATKHAANKTQARGFLEKAVTYYEMVFAQQDTGVDATTAKNVLQAYRLLEQTDKAIAFGQRAITLQPKDATLLDAYADALNEAGRQKEAVDMLDRALQLDPELKGVYGKKALWRLQTGDLDGARVALRTARDKGQLEGELQDQIAKQIAAAGQKKGEAGQYQTAAQYYEVGKQFATTPQTRGMIAFLEGYDIYRVADAEARKQETSASARAMLPKFRRVVELMDQAAVWPDAGAARLQIKEAAESHIKRAQQIIGRGN